MGDSNSRMCDVKDRILDDIEDDGESRIVAAGIDEIERIAQMFAPGMQNWKGDRVASAVARWNADRAPDFGKARVSGLSRLFYSRYLEVDARAALTDAEFEGFTSPDGRLPDLSEVWNVYSVAGEEGKKVRNLLGRVQIIGDKGTTTRVVARDSSPLHMERLEADTAHALVQLVRGRIGGVGPFGGKSVIGMRSRTLTEQWYHDNNGSDSLRRR